MIRQVQGSRRFYDEQVSLFVLILYCVVLLNWNINQLPYPCICPFAWSLNYTAILGIQCLRLLSVQYMLFINSIYFHLRLPIAVYSYSSPFRPASCLICLLMLLRSCFTLFGCHRPQQIPRLCFINI